MTGIRAEVFSRVDRPAGRHARVGGFTLIELMVVVAIVAILVGIALPSYQDSVRKGRRGQAKADLVELAQRVERWRTVNNTYAGFAMGADDDQSPRQGTPAYDVALDIPNDNEFTLTATPANGQVNDVRCMILTLDQAGRKTESGTATDIGECW